ncbi:MAG: hypothetical protein DRP58_10070 [Spirochaetes bacterium]|nr:MAG: hypothetical protein DRP58_10070 [Spirochaetota bacterium]
MLKINLGNYIIERVDKWNITLSVTRNKQVSALHPNVDTSETTIETLGYYSNLQSTMKSLLNRSVLDDSDTTTVHEVLEAISRVESLIDLHCIEPELEIEKVEEH